MALTNVAQFNRWTRRRDAAVFGVLTKAMLISLSEVAGVMRSTSAFNDITGNLRASIGHFGPLKANDGDVGLGRPNLRKNIQGTRETIQAHLPIGMEYAQYVQINTDFTGEAVDAAEGIFTKNLEQAAAFLAAKL